MRTIAERLKPGMAVNLFGILCAVEEVVLPRPDIIGPRLVTFRLSYDTSKGSEMVSVELPEKAIVVALR